MLFTGSKFEHGKRFASYGWKEGIDQKCTGSEFGHGKRFDSYGWKEGIDEKGL